MHRHYDADLWPSQASKQSVLPTQQQEAKQVKYTFYLDQLLGKLTSSFTLRDQKFCP